MKSVAIIEGWAAGAWHTKQVRKLLKNAGFVISRKNNSEIIIAHSAGVFGMPSNSRSKLIVMIGIPYWPERSILKRLMLNLKHDVSREIARNGRGYIIKKSLWWMYYFFTRPKYTFLGLRHGSDLSFLEKYPDKKIIVIRNDEDDICTPQIESLLNQYKNIKYIKMPGGHDDYYLNPAPYVDLLLKEL